MRSLSTALLILLSTTSFAQAPVRVAEAEIRDIIQQVAATGTVSSPRSALLSTAVAGLVADIEVDAGDRVSRGDRLLELDAEIAELTLARLRAAARQRATTLADVERRLEEAEKVGPEGGIPPTLIDSLRTEMRIAEAALAAAQAEAGEQQARVERHRLAAPFDGVITRRITEIGEWVTPGSGLLELVATSGLRFEFRVAQRFLADITRDTPVVVSLDSMPDGGVRARVDAIVPVGDPGSRTFLVRAVADSPAQRVGAAPGMSASAVFSLQTNRRGVTVPRDALLRFSDGRNTVWVVAQRDGKPEVQERIVQTGLEFDGVVEVSSGLESGERVVVEGNESLRDGQAVRILGPGG